MSEKVQCKICGQPILTQKQIDHITRIISKSHDSKVIDTLTLCPNCRKEKFVREMIGNRLEKVVVLGYIPKHRSEKLQSEKYDPATGMTILKSSCWSCNNGCDASVFVKDGKVVKVEGDVSSPTTRGMLCAKGLASKYLLYHPERLLYPLKRAGKRGENKWERITWDEALDTIATNFKDIEEKYGKDSIFLATGTSRGWVQYFNRFSNAFHKQVTGPGYAQCLWPRYTSQLLMGISPALECPDLFEHPDKTKCILVWGTNPPNTSPMKASWIMDAKALGAKLIVVDIMLSEMASKADLWLQPRPGTDAALLLGMLNVIVRENLYDREFVETWCNGFEELKSRAKEYPPEKVAGITGVPSGKIFEAARMYAKNKPASLVQCLSTEQIPDTISACVAMGILTSITGNIDVPGGNVVPMPVNVVPEFTLRNLQTKEDNENRLGAKEFPLLSGVDSWNPVAHAPTIWRTILSEKPYPIKALYCQGSNPAVSYANSNLVMKALSKLDFIAVADFFMTQSAQLADMVLPVATWMERSSVQNYFQVTYNDLHLQQKAVEVGECWSDYKILNELGKKLGFGEQMLPSEDALSDLILKPLGMTYEEFRKLGRHSVPYTYKKYEGKGFGHPAFKYLHSSNKVELAPPKLKSLGFDPLPKHKEPTESPISTPEIAKQYPFILTTGRKEAVFRHSEFRNIPVLREIVPHPLVYLNPVTATASGIKQGDPVIVESLRGSMEAKAYITEGIAPNVVFVPAQWSGKNNANVLLHDEDTAPAIGSAQLRCQLCRVRRAG